jgi:hypothetical protein
MNDQQNSLPTVPDNESSQAGSLALPVNKPTGKVFVFMNGWIKLHRSFLDWGWFSEDKMVRFFVYLLLKANYEDGEWMGIKIKRGELVTGRKSLSQNLQLPEQTVRTLLCRLKSTSEITIRSTNKYSIITICNYDYYQNFSIEDNQQTNQQIPNEQPATNQQLTTVKEVKEDKKPRNNKIFIPPILEDVKTYFKDNGYSEQSSVRFFNYYSTAEWKDSQGKQVRNWKQKALGVWFKPENKTIIQTGISPYKPFEGYETRPPDKGI